MPRDSTIISARDAVSKPSQDNKYVQLRCSKTYLASQQNSQKGVPPQNHTLYSCAGNLENSRAVALLSNPR